MNDLIADMNTLIFLGCVIIFIMAGWGITALGKFSSPGRKKTAGFRFIATGALILASFYLYWRYRYSLNPDAMLLAVLLVAAESYAYIDSLLFLIMMWKPTYRHSPPALNGSDVDIFITTYNEPVDLVRLTVEAALRIDWDTKHIYILDDGDRPEFTFLADELGCGIITRGSDWQGKPRHAKAGNVNNALLQTSGEYILILDADQIPAPGIIRKTIGYFRDERMAFVQTPQYFYNLPPGDPFGSDAPLFYGPILQGKDGWNAAFFCGSNAILRREALLQLGIIEYARTMLRHAKKTLKAMARGLRRAVPHSANERELIMTMREAVRSGRRRLKMGDPVEEIFETLRTILSQGEPSEHDPQDPPPGLCRKHIAALEVTRYEEAIPLLPLSTISVTEDMATSIRIHAHGWKSAFHPEILAYGLAPEDLASSLSQRLRWAQGTIQILVKENPLTTKGLKPGQRIQYFTTIYSYFSGFASLIFILAPIIFLFTGIAPVRVYSADFLWRLLPFLIFNRLMFRYISAGRNVRRGEQYSLALFPLWIRAVLGVIFGRKPKFVVTPKQRQSGNFLRLVWIQIACFILSVGGVLYCLALFFIGKPFNTLGIIINGFWALYNAAHLLTIIRAAVYRPPSGWEGNPPEEIVHPKKRDRKE